MTIYRVAPGAPEDEDEKINVADFQFRDVSDPYQNIDGLLRTSPELRERLRADPEYSQLVNAWEYNEDALTSAKSMPEGPQRARAHKAAADAMEVVNRYAAKGSEPIRARAAKLEALDGEPPEIPTSIAVVDPPEPQPEEPRVARGTRLEPETITGRMPEAPPPDGDEVLSTPEMMVEPPQARLPVRAPALPPEPDVMGALLAAQGRSNDNALVAGLMRAGATIGNAISRGNAPPDEQGLRQLAAGADRPMQEFGAALQTSDALRKRKLEDAKNDPNSPSARAKAAMIEKTFPGLYTPEELAAITDANAEFALEPAKFRATLKAQTAAAEATRNFQASEHAATQKFQAGEHAATQRFQAGENQKDREAAMDRAKATLGATKFEKDVQKAGAELEPFARMADDINWLNATVAEAQKNNEDIPGAGMWDSWKPGIMQSSADTDVRQRALDVLNRTLFMESGKAVTASELKRQAKAAGLGEWATEQEFAQGLQKVAARAQRAMEQRQARFRPEVIGTLQERGGKLADAIEVPPPDGAPNVVRKDYSRSRDKTRLTYSDGRTEEVNGRR